MSKVYNSPCCGNCKFFHYMNYRDGSGFLTSWCDKPEYKTGKYPKFLDFNDEVCNLYIQRWISLDHSKCLPDSVCKKPSSVKVSNFLEERYEEWCKTTKVGLPAGTDIYCIWCDAKTSLRETYCPECGHSPSIPHTACMCLICGTIKMALLNHMLKVEREDAKKESAAK